MSLLHLLSSPYLLLPSRASYPLFTHRCGWWKRSVAPFTKAWRNPRPGTPSTTSWRTPSFSSTTTFTTYRWSTTRTLTTNPSGPSTTTSCTRPSESPLLLRFSIRNVLARHPAPTASTASPPLLTATTTPSRVASTTRTSPQAPAGTGHRPHESSTLF